MIHDQANDLREMVRSSSRAPDVRLHQKTRTIMVIGGKGGVGTTTLALNLAVALAQRQCKTMLTEAVSPGGDIALLCSNESISIPNNLRIVANAPLSVDWPQDLQLFEDRLHGKDTAHEMLSELVVVDGGHYPNHLWHSLASTAELVLVATTADPASIVGSHAVIKMLRKTTSSEKIFTVVNQIHRASAADEVHKRLHRACRRFLGIHLHHAGYVIHDPAVNAAGRNRQPFMLSSPTSHASRQVRALAEKVSKKINETRGYDNLMTKQISRAA